MENEGGLVVRGRVEIDMRQPFRSVKEAISLFGEKVLAGEIYANKIKEMQTRGNAEGRQQPKQGTLTAELQDTKQSLQKATEEENLMACYLSSLKQELEQTKKELQQLKTTKESTDIKPLVDIEELKFVEESTAKVEVKTQTEDHDGGLEFEKKRSVKFASPPLLTKVIATKDDGAGEKLNQADHPSSPSFEKKVKRKPLIPFIGVLFPKKKGIQKKQIIPSKALIS